MQLPERNASGDLPAYGWPGGYPLIYLSADGSEWCASCASPEAEPPIVAAQVHWEGPPITCDGCGVEIASAYGDPATDESGDCADLAADPDCECARCRDRIAARTPDNPLGMWRAYRDRGELREPYPADFLRAYAAVGAAFRAGA